MDLGKISEDKLMETLGIESKMTIWKMRQRGEIVAYSFAGSKQNYYDVEQLKKAFQPKTKEQNEPK